MKIKRLGADLVTVIKDPLPPDGVSRDPPHISGSGWDSGSVPKGLRPGGTQATFSQTGQLLIDPQASSINVTALVGKQAVLGCFIRNINNHSVSHGQAV